MYFLSDIDGRITLPISLYTAIRLLLFRGLQNLSFGESVFIEDESGNLLYKLSWFENRPTKLINH